MRCEACGRRGVPLQRCQACDSKVCQRCWVRCDICGEFVCDNCTDDAGCPLCLGDKP